MRMVFAAGTLALVLAGCSGVTSPRPAAIEQMISTSATVESVDQATRHVVLVGPDGDRFGVLAGPDVRNLAQVRPGDTVSIDYYDSVVLTMAEPDAAQGTLAAAARTPEGARPGAAAVVATDVVVTVVSYDARSGFATFRTDDGVTHRATVPPELRTFAERRAPGSRVKISMTEAMAVRVTEG